MMKMADNGFFSGPLVMQGMLTAFRTEALFAINGFTTGHLIEDYEITTRLKKEGWHVAIVPSSWAWTEVPNSLWTLWKQRVRWSYGGVQVLRSNWRFLPAILQDFIGHVMFVATSILIVLSFVIPRGEVDTQIVGIIILLAIAQSGFAYLTHLFLMRFYADRETYDWIIRATLVPELIYSYLMSLVLIGSYLFFAYNAIWRRIQARLPRTYAIQQLGLGLFARVGYSADWGTKETNSNQVISKEVSQIV
jgi:cellulose synthase/poly-beta-1,6-N-acetylglucosamine synthase-like glycosyltransferase